MNIRINSLSFYCIVLIFTLFFTFTGLYAQTPPPLPYTLTLYGPSPVNVVYGGEIEFTAYITNEDTGHEVPYNPFEMKFTWELAGGSRGTLREIEDNPSYTGNKITYCAPQENISGERATLICVFSLEIEAGPPPTWVNIDRVSEVIRIIDSRIPSPLYSEIIPNPANALFYQKLELSMIIRDHDTQDDMTESFKESEFSSFLWELVEGSIGEIEVNETDNSKAIFYTTKPQGTDFEIARVTCLAQGYEGIIRIRKEVIINVYDINNGIIYLDGLREVHDRITEPVAYNVKAVYNPWTPEADTCDVPIEWIEDILVAYDNYGEFAITDTTVNYLPEETYLGKLDFEIKLNPEEQEYNKTAIDTIIVYRKVLEFEPEETIYCFNSPIIEIDLPEDMTIDGYLHFYFMKDANTNKYSTMSFTSDMQLLNNEYFEARIDSVSSNTEVLYPYIKFDLSKDKIHYPDKDYKLSWWEQRTEYWQPIQNLDRAVRLQMDNKKVRYGILEKSDPLGLYAIKLLPNPFTPRDKITFPDILVIDKDGNPIPNEMKGLLIKFRISSRQTKFPMLTCKVYNLQGTLVKTVIDRKPIAKGSYDFGEEYALNWDGTTDAGKDARNGRYIVHFIVEDSGKKHSEDIKTVVLIR